jgi:hypothetical protein
MIHYFVRAGCRKMKTLLKSMKDEMNDDRQRYSEREFYGEIGFGGVLIERLSVCPSANSPAS